MTTHSPRVLLYSGWQTVNIGDIGHTPGTLRYLAEAWPTARVTLWRSNTTPAVTAMLRRRFPHVPIVEGQLDSAGRATSSALQAAFDDCTVFIQNFGMHFNRFWDTPLNMLDACRAHRKPLCLYGQSFDGLPSGHETTLPARLSETALITTRDRDSLAFLRSLDVRPRGGLSFGPDGCFGIDVRDDAAAEAFLEKTPCSLANSLRSPCAPTRRNSTHPAATRSTPQSPLPRTRRRMPAGPPRWNEAANFRAQRMFGG